MTRGVVGNTAVTRAVWCHCRDSDWRTAGLGSYLCFCTRWNRRMHWYGCGARFDLTRSWSRAAGLRVCFAPREQWPCASQSSPPRLEAGECPPRRSPAPVSHNRILGSTSGRRNSDLATPKSVTFLHNLALSSLPHFIIGKIFLSHVQNTTQT